MKIGLNTAPAIFRIPQLGGGNSNFLRRASSIGIFVCVFLIGIFHEVPFAHGAGKLPQPSSFKLRLKQNKEAGDEIGGGAYKAFAVPFSYPDRVDKTTFVVGLTNTSSEAMEFGIENVQVIGDKGKALEVLTKAEAIGDLEEETAALEKDINTRGDLMLRQAKGFKRSKERSLENYTKSVGNRSMASQMDFGGTGNDEDDAYRDKIKKAIDDSLVIIQEDHKAGLARIEQKYLNDVVAVPPGQSASGYFELRIPKKIPKQITLEISAGEENIKFSFDISRQKL